MPLVTLVSSLILSLSAQGRMPTRASTSPIPDLSVSRDSSTGSDSMAQSSRLSSRPNPLHVNSAIIPRKPLLGFLIFDDMYGLRLGAGDKSDTGWMVLVQGGVRSKVENLSTEPAHTIRSSFDAWQIQLKLERYFPAFQRISYLLSFAAGYEHSETSRTRHDSVTTKVLVGGYQQDRFVEAISNQLEKDASLLGTLGIGLRLQVASNMYAIGGMEIGPSWTDRNTSETSTGKDGTGTLFELRDPTWSLGVDWYF